MKTVSSLQMRELDKLTIKSGVPGGVLMERAGTGAGGYILEFISSLHPSHVKRFIVLAGKGNNGGDAHVVARFLSQNSSIPVKVLSICHLNELSGDAKLNAEKLPANVPCEFRNDLKSERQTVLGCSAWDRDTSDTGNVERYRKNIFEVHRERVALLAKFEGGRRSRREGDDVALPEGVVVFAAQGAARGLGLVVVGVNVARGEHEGAEEDAAARLFAESGSPREHVVVKERLAALREAVAHTVEAREIR